MRDSSTYEVRTVSFSAAVEVMRTAVDKAKEVGVSAVVAIVDRSGELKAFGRMDSAPLLSVDIAQDKAWTVAAFGLATHEWTDAIAGDPGLEKGFGKIRRLIIFGGGVPLMSDEEIIGAIGVSGGTPEEDRIIAQAGAAWLNEEKRSPQ